MKRKIAIFILGALLMTNLNMFAFAADNNTQIISPCWVNIGRISGHLTVNGDTGNISIAISGNNDVTKITATATLYYKNSKGSWVKMKDWKYSVNSDVLAINETFDASAASSYKVILTADVYADGYTESVTKEFT